MKNDTWDFLPDFKTRESENKILQIFFNTDLRCAHDGLAILAKKEKLNVDKLRVGQFLVFMNTKQSQLKIYAAGRTIAHFKMPNHRRMNLKVLQMIPRFFNGKELKYDEALSEIIKAEIKTK